MRAVVQRVSRASVFVDGKVVSNISKGMVVLLGILQGDDARDASWMASKIGTMRIFEDSQGKTNCSLREVGGELLLVSQFTLAANVERGRRPDFFAAMEPTHAKKLFEQFVFECGKITKKEPKCGVFGAYMQIELLNDGPFTVLLDSPTKGI